VRAKLEVMRGILCSHSFRFTDERELQDSIAAVLAPLYHVAREVIAGADRFDLKIGPIVIEVKTKGGAAAALQQCVRYLGRDDVDGLILVGPPTWGGSASMPRELGGKPFLFCPIGRAAF
jgi:hypothetical protein